MKHLLITRFNVPFKRRDSWRDKSWIDDRIEKLERLSAPSIRAQDCADFEYWLIACPTNDPSIDSSIVSVAERVGAKVTWMIPDETEARGRAIERAAGSDELEVAVTRVDSDDVLHSSFVRRVQSKFDARRDDFFVINPLVGLIAVDGRIAVWPYVASNFLTSVHRRQPGEILRTAYDFSHDRVHDIAPVVQVISRPLWLFPVHGNNTAIDDMRGIHVPAPLFRRRFPALTDVEMKRWSPVLTMRSATRLLGRMKRSGSSRRAKTLVARKS